METLEVVVKKMSTTKSLHQTQPNKVRAKEVSELEKDIVARLAVLAGHRTADIRSVRKDFSRLLAERPPALVIALALRLARDSETVPKFFAYELIQHHPQALRSLNSKSLSKLGQGNSSWGEVDSFACYLAGPVWRERQVSDSLIERWACSQDRWWRRTSLASTIALNNKARGGRGDARRTLLICEKLIHDRDDMVVKALSWALRELSKRDAQSVRKFLAEHSNELAPRVVREVNSKLQTGLKNPRSRIVR